MKFNNYLSFILIMVIITTTSCLNNKPKEYEGNEYKYGVKKGIMDTFDISMSVNSGRNLRSFTITYTETGESDTYQFNPKQEGLEAEKKTFDISGTEKEIIRYQIENINPISGKAFIYYDEEKPLVVVWRNWATYFTYITNNEDLTTANSIISDTTCFFKCPKE